jgi:hypothetical protein
MPVIANDFSDMKIPVYITAHAKPKIMATQYEDPLKIVGVEALNFFSSNIYQMTKVVNSDDRENATTARCKPKKSRFCSSNFKMDLGIIYKEGIRRDTYLLDLMKNEKLITGKSNSTYTGVDALEGMSFTGNMTRSKPIDECMGEEYLKKLDDYLISKYRLGGSISEIDELSTTDDIYTKEELFTFSVDELKKIYQDMKGTKCIHDKKEKIIKIILQLQSK